MTRRTAFWYAFLFAWATVTVTTLLVELATDRPRPPACTTDLRMCR